MDLGPHATTILACYGVVFAAIAGMIAWLAADGRRHARELAGLEARGIRRRSESQTPTAKPETNSRA